MSRPIRVFIAEDQAIVRKGIRALLATEPGITVVGEAASGSEAVAEVARLQPDVVLMDLVMPGMDGVEAIRQITGRLPDTRILVLTSFAVDDKIFPAIRAGARGYLLKDSGPQDLVNAIRQVSQGQAPLHPEIASRLLQEIDGRTKRPPTAEHLTPRERDVLRLIAGGLSNAQIAGELSLGEATVRTHVSAILGKLGLASRTQAALFAIREGLATLPENDRP